MPQMEYLVLAEYVRQDAGMTHIMGAGIDTFTVPESRLPAGVPVGVVARMTFDVRDQVGAEHEVSLIFHGPGNTELLRLTQRLRTPPPAPGVPEHWRTAANLIFRGCAAPPELWRRLPARGRHGRRSPAVAVARRSGDCA